jgi:hypothetical protein
MLISKLNQIQQHTAQQRLEGYLGSLRKSGYFQYDSKQIEANGNVHYPGRVIPLRGDVPIFKLKFPLRTIGRWRTTCGRHMVFARDGHSCEV